MKLRLKLILLTILAAVLMPLAIPNDFIKYGSPILGLVCLVPLFYAICKSPTYGFASILGIIFGGLSNGLMYYWLAFFGEYSVWTLGGPIIGYMAYNALLAPYLRGFAKEFPRYRIFTLSMAWIVYELIKSTGFLGFPWGIMAHPYHMLLPFIQIAEITGIWGISLLVVSVNALITEALLRWPVFSIKKIKAVGFLKGVDAKWMKEGAFIFSLILLTLIFGIIRLNIKLPTPKTVSVLMVQPNRDPWRNSNRDLTILECEELTERGLQSAAGKPDIIIWSETIFQYPIMDRPEIFENIPAKKPFFPFVRETGAYFLVGAPKVISWDPINAMNSTILINPEGEPTDFYGKQHPVPAAESIPLWEVEFIQKFFKEVIGLEATWAVGKDRKIFEIPLDDGNTLRFSTPICFEDAFPDLNRLFIKKGADVLINLTNVSWSQRESAEIQMFVASKFRSVETKRLLFRSTNSGVTSIIGPFGRTLKALPLFEPGFIHMELPVPIEKNLTLYTLLGDWLPQFLFVFIMSILILKNTGLAAKIGNTGVWKKYGLFFQKRKTNN